MKRRQKILTWVIALVFVLILIGYGVLSLGVLGKDAPAPIKGLSVVTGAALVTVIIMMVITAVQRNREIEEEDKDDLSKY